MSLLDLFIILKGGPRSGNWGHAGRPGKKGGSSPRSIAMSLRTGRDWKVRQEEKGSFKIPVNEVTEKHVNELILDRMSQKRAEGLLEELKGLIKDAPVEIRIPSRSLAKVLEDGEFKNQHETKSSGGYLDPDFRAAAERNAFGADLKDPKDFPIYGYVNTEKNGLVPEVFFYGEMKVIFKDSIKQRTTITAGDSLGDFQDGTMVGTPINNPRISSLDQMDKYPISDYVEAQIHGPVTLKDIEKVIIGKNSRIEDMDRVQPLLDKMKIPYEFEDESVS